MRQKRKDGSRNKYDCRDPLVLTTAPKGVAAGREQHDPKDYPVREHGRGPDRIAAARSTVDQATTRRSACANFPQQGSGSPHFVGRTPGIFSLVSTNVS